MAQYIENPVYFAKMAAQTERYEEMVEILKHVTSSSETLTFEERGLLSIAYKNVISARRASWYRWRELYGKNFTYKQIKIRTKSVKGIYSPSDVERCTTGRTKSAR